MPILSKQSLRYHLESLADSELLEGNSSFHAGSAELKLEVDFSGNTEYLVILAGSKLRFVQYPLNQ